MKIILLILALAIGGEIAVSLYTVHKAKLWMLLYWLGKYVTVQFEMSPQWAIAQPVGGQICCSRIYSVNVRITR